MAEVKGDEWLPEGWKVEVRVRRSGRRDRYYTDPASGYVFRSLKDIDRYLLTGKLGRHVVKSKTNDVAGGSDLVLDSEKVPGNVLEEDASKGKNSNLSNESEKLPLGVQRLKPATKGKKKPSSGGIKSTEKCKNRKISKSPQKKGSDLFFMLDPDQGANEFDRSNLPEIIDSVGKCEDSRNATYLSAPEIAALLGRQMPLEDAANQGDYKYPTPQEAPLVASKSNIEAETEAVLDEKWGLDSLWGDICSDPCIEFAIKTLTGAIPMSTPNAGAAAAELQARKEESEPALNRAVEEECDVEGALGG